MVIVKETLKTVTGGKKAKQSALYIFPKPIHKTWVRKDPGRISEVNPSHMSMTLLGQSQELTGLSQVAVPFGSSNIGFYIGTIN